MGRMHHRLHAVFELLLDVTLKDQMQMLIGEAGAAALPLIEFLPPEEGKEPQETIAYINRTAVFKKDKMIGELDDKLTRGVLWFRNEIKHATVTVEMNEDEGQGHISAKLLRAETELIPEIKNGKWKITVHSVTEDDIVSNGSKLNLMNPQFIKLLEKKLQKDLEHRMTITLDKVQKELKADILGFAEAFHRKYPKEWQKVKDEWDDVFPKVEVSYDIKIYVRRPGMNTTPQGLPEKEVKKK